MSHILDQNTVFRVLKTPPPHKNTPRKTPGTISVSNWSQRKVIDFTGNIKQNIEQLMRDLPCICGQKSGFRQIMSTYADKIMRLRGERDSYKQTANKYKSYVRVLKNKLEETETRLRQCEENYFEARQQAESKFRLQEYQLQRKVMEENLEDLQNTNNDLIQALRCLESQLNRQKRQGATILVEDRQSEDKVSQIRHRQTYVSDESDLLDYSENPKECSLFKEQILLPQDTHKQSVETVKAKLEKYQKMFREFNMTPEDIYGILREYVSQMPAFNTKEERDLYKLAFSMNGNLWRKKVEVDIKDICERRQKLRKYEQQIRRKAQSISNI